MCHRTGKYTVCRHVRASFSPDILQAGAVEGVRAIVFKTVKTLKTLACPERKHDYEENVDSHFKTRRNQQIQRRGDRKISSRKGSMGH